MSVPGDLAPDRVGDRDVAHVALDATIRVVVTIALDGRDVAMTPVGWSRVWTLRRRIRFPLSSIRSVRRAAPGIGRGIWHGWRLPGTHIPGVLVAGSYYHAGRWEFWDVRVANERAIEVELENGPYARVVVDVADPEFEVERLRAAAPFIR